MTLNLPGKMGEFEADFDTTELLVRHQEKKQKALEEPFLQYVVGKYKNGSWGNEIDMETRGENDHNKTR